MSYNKINSLPLKDPNGQSNQNELPIRSNKNIITLGSKSSRNKSGRFSQQQKQNQRTSFNIPRQSKQVTKLSLLSVQYKKTKQTEIKNQGKHKQIIQRSTNETIGILNKIIAERNQKILQLEQQNIKHHKQIAYLTNNFQNFCRGLKIENQNLKHRLTEKNSIISQLTLQKDSFPRSLKTEYSEPKYSRQKQTQNAINKKNICQNCIKLLEEIKVTKANIQSKNKQNPLSSPINQSISESHINHKAAFDELNKLKTHQIENYEQQIQTLEDCIKKIEIKLQIIIQQYKQLVVKISN